jgi:hypothetical protein
MIESVKVLSPTEVYIKSGSQGRQF